MKCATDRRKCMAKVQMCVTENVKEPSLYVAIDTVGLIKVSELSYLRQT